MSEANHESTNHEEAVLFDEVNDMLGQDSPPPQDQQVQALSFKLTEMQKICKTLTKSNSKLMARVQELEEELEGRQEREDSGAFSEEYSEMQVGFMDIEELIKEYKRQLEHYQQKHASQLQEKQAAALELEEQVASLKKNNQELTRRLEEAEYENSTLQETNEGLLVEIEEMENSIRRSKYQSPRGNKRVGDYLDGVYGYDTDRSDFGASVQQELEKLIEKLIRELEHERAHKKKLGDEIKHLQREVVQLERDLVAKNNTIYELELNAIKRNKPPNPSNHVTPNSPGRTRQRAPPEPRAQGSRQRDLKQSKTIRSFSIMQIMNEAVELDSREKLVLSLKIVDFYLRQMEGTDYSSHVLEALTVHNYSPNNPNLMTVRLNRTLDSQSQQEFDCTESEVVWNLAFVLDNLFTQSLDRDKDFGELTQEVELMEVVTGLLENRENNSFHSVVELRKLLEEAVGLRRR